MSINAIWLLALCLGGIGAVIGIAGIVYIVWDHRKPHSRRFPM